MIDVRAVRLLGVGAALAATVAAMPSGHSGPHAVLAGPAATLSPDSISGVLNQRKLMTLRADMGTTGDSLGSYAVTIAWDSTVLRLDSVGKSADYGDPTVRFVHAGQVVLTQANAAGMKGAFSLAKLYFRIANDTAGKRTTVQTTFTEFNAAGSFTDLLPQLSAPGGVARVLAPAVTVSFTPDSIRQRVGYKPEIDLTADLSSDPDVALGSYTADVSWDATIMLLDSVRAGSVGTPQSTQPTTGSLRISSADAVGGTGKVVAARLFFRYVNATFPSQTTLTLAVSELSAAQSFGNLLPGMTIKNGKALIGGWLRGDVNVNDAIASNDALTILKLTVGLSVSGVGSGVPQGDADCNGAISAKDAQLVLNYIVGNPVSSYCVGKIQ